MLDLFRRQHLEIKYFKIQERGPWMLRCSIWMFWDLWVCGCVCGCVGVWVCGCVGVWVCVWWWVCGCGGGVCVCVCVCVGVCDTFQNTSNIRSTYFDFLKIRTSQIRIHKQSRFSLYLLQRFLPVRHLCMAIGMLSGCTQHGTI